MPTIIATALGALLALSACEPSASPSTTSTLEPTTTAAQSSAGAVAPARTPEPRSSARRPMRMRSRSSLAARTASPGAPTSPPAPTTPPGNGRFLPGLTFTLPAGWSSLDNEAGELELHRTGDDHNEICSGAMSSPGWMAAPRRRRRQIPRRGSAAARNPCLDVSEPERVVLGDWIDLRDGGAGRSPGDRRVGRVAPQRRRDGRLPGHRPDRDPGRSHAWEASASTSAATR